MLINVRGKEASGILWLELKYLFERNITNINTSTLLSLDKTDK